MSQDKGHTENGILRSCMYMMYHHLRAVFSFVLSPLETIRWAISFSHQSNHSPLKL